MLRSRETKFGKLGQGFAAHVVFDLMENDEVTPRIDPEPPGHLSGATPRLACAEGKARQKFKKMKQQPEDSEDSSFDNFLRTATVELPLPGAFQADVWRRIAVCHQASIAVRFSCWMEKVFGWLGCPVPAAATLLFMISAGIWFGSQGSEPGENGKFAYVRSVSPFAAEHEGGHQ